MLKSLENALNKFGHEKQVLVMETRLKSKVGNIIIPKKIMAGTIMVEDDVYTHTQAEVFTYKTLCKELGISMADVEIMFPKDYSDKFEVGNLWNKKEGKKNNQLTLNILDLISTEKGWKSSQSTWFNDTPMLIIDNLDGMAFPEIKSVDKSYYKRFNIVDSNKLVAVDPVVIKDKIKLLELLGLYSLVIEELIEDLDATADVAIEHFENYLSDHSLNYVIRFSSYGFDSKKMKVQIKIGVEIPTYLTRERDKLVTHQFEISLNEFGRISNMVIARKKLIHKFSNSGINLTSIPSMKKEKIIWFNDGTYLYQYSILDKEIELIESIFKDVISYHRKNTSISIIQLKHIFDRVHMFYSLESEFDESYTPCGPDTSKFVSVVSGKVNFKENFTMGDSYYHRGTNFSMGLQIGGNYKYGNPYAIMFYILKYVYKYYGLPEYTSRPMGIVCASGTSYSAVGVN